MATHKSAVKRHRQSVVRAARNRDSRSTIRTAIKKVDTLVAKGDFAGAKDAVRAATKLIDTAKSHGLFPAKRASRTVSRINARVSKASKTPAKA